MTPEESLAIFGASMGISFALLVLIVRECWGGCD